METLASVLKFALRIGTGPSLAKQKHSPWETAKKVSWRSTIERSRDRIKIQTTNGVRVVEENVRHWLVEKRKKKEKREKKEARKGRKWLARKRKKERKDKRKRTKWVTRLVERMDRTARSEDGSRSCPEIFIIPFKHFHRKIGLTSCSDVVTFSVKSAEAENSSSNFIRFRWFRVRGQLPFYIQCSLYSVSLR